MCIMGKDPRRERANQDPVVAVVAVVVVVAAESMLAGKPSGKGKKVPLPTDICWRCGKGRHQKGQPCKAVEAVCRNCGTKGHYEKVCMKKSTHLVNVPGTSTDSEPDYFNEHGDLFMPTHTWFMLRRLIERNTSSNSPLVQISRK